MKNISKQYWEIYTYPKVLVMLNSYKCDYKCYHFLYLCFHINNSKIKKCFCNNKRYFLLLKSVKVNMKNILTQLSIPKVLWHNSFVVMPWFTKRQCQGVAGTVWSTSPGPKLPTPDAACSSLPWPLPTKMTCELPNRHTISLTSKDQKNRHCLHPLFSQYICPILSRLAGNQTTFPPSPIKTVPKLVTTEATSSSQRCLKSSNLFSSQVTEFFSSKLS